jgi:hypothetical protein
LFIADGFFPFNQRLHIGWFERVPGIFVTQLPPGDLARGVSGDWKTHLASVMLDRGGKLMEDKYSLLAYPLARYSYVHVQGVF